MPLRNSLLFRIVFFPVLTACALVVVLFSAPVFSFLQCGALVVALLAVGGGCVFALRLHRRLGSLRAFIAAVRQSDVLLTLSAGEDEDELSAIERELQQMVMKQRERLGALQGERSKLAVVLHSMAEGVAVIDPAGNVVLCNHAWRDLFGLQPDADWQGKALQIFSRHPSLHELLREVASQQPNAMPVKREIELDGREQRQLAISAMQLREDGITLSGYVLVSYDITQLKRLESVRAEFVANVSHELRTPLTAIKGYAETLLNGALQAPDTARRFLAIIDRHSERLSRLIEDLLTLSNLELGRTEIRDEEVGLAELVSEVFELVKEKAARAAITLAHEIPADLPMITGDSDRLHQVLMNLVDNAVKYTQAGGTVTVAARTVWSPTSGVQSPKSKVPDPQSAIPDPHSALRASLVGGWVEIAVTDTGCGIPEAEIPRVTQRFYRVDKARSRELGGTGLGLAIVKHIVQAHNGFLRIESQVNHGTTARLFLPLHTPASDFAE